MKGDFTRGHRPDAQRDQRYRRVLLQQGRLSLDSDVAAGADAVDRLVRDLARDVGARSGSPDLGYLVTPGPLVAQFDTLDQLRPPVARTTPGAFLAYRDFEERYLGRLASLYLCAPEYASGYVRIATRARVIASRFPRLRLWAKIPPGVQLSVRIGTFVTSVTGATGSTAFLPYDLDVSGVSQGFFDSFEVGFAPGAGGYGGYAPYGGGTHAPREARLGLVEGLEAAGSLPTFWVASGRYYVDGLEVLLGKENENQRYPQPAWPSPFPLRESLFNRSPGLPLGARILVYLEAWERLVTHVERPGIRDVALGGLDTSVRTEALGQVKLARIDVPKEHDGAALPVRIAEAFANVRRGHAFHRVIVEPEPGAATTDPCANGAAGGYGGDNRLYRIEVHVGGNLGAAQLKWSKNNGSELFEVKEIPSLSAAIVALAPAAVSAPGGSSLQDGDLVELLSEQVDLVDAAPSQLDWAAPAFLPPERMANRALYLVKTAGDSGQIQLLDRDTGKPASLAAVVANQDGLKLRRWDGLIQTTSTQSPNVVSLGDGLRVRVQGSDFHVGDYWQHEARKLGENANGVPDGTADGPERLFAPLAVLRYEGYGSPLVLETWLDTRFDPLAELDADGVAYDGAKAGITSRTVQEAIDLLVRRGASSTIESVKNVLSKRGVFHDHVLTKGAELPFERLAEGLLLEANPDVTLANAGEVDCSVALELPFPHGAADVETWGAAAIGSQPLRLSGRVEPNGPRNLLWRPAPETTAWLRDRLPELVGRPSFDFFSSVDKDRPKWSIGSQHQLLYANRSAPLTPGSWASGAAAVLRRPAARGRISLEAMLTVPPPASDQDPPHGNENHFGLIYDWQGPTEYRAVVCGASCERSAFAVTLQKVGPNTAAVTQVLVKSGRFNGPQAAAAVAGAPCVLRYSYWTDQACWTASDAAAIRTALLGAGASVEVKRQPSGQPSDQYGRLRLLDYQVTGGRVKISPGAITFLAGPGVWHLDDPPPAITMTLDGTGLWVGIPSRSYLNKWENIRSEVIGKRFGFFTTGQAEAWELTDGVQSLHPNHPTVRARLRLQRSGAAWTRGDARAAPFLADYETSFALRVGWPTAYGTGWVQARPATGAYGMGPEFPGIGAELIE